MCRREEEEEEEEGLAEKTQDHDDGECGKLSGGLPARGRHVSAAGGAGSMAPVGPGAGVGSREGSFGCSPRGKAEQGTGRTKGVPGAAGGRGHRQGQHGPESRPCGLDHGDQGVLQLPPDQPRRLQGGRLQRRDGERVGPAAARTGTRRRKHRTLHKDDQGRLGRLGHGRRDQRGRPGLGGFGRQQAQADPKEKPLPRGDQAREPVSLLGRKPEEREVRNCPGQLPGHHVAQKYNGRPALHQKKRHLPAQQERLLRLGGENTGAGGHAGGQH